MGRKLLVGSGMLIGLYLVLINGTNTKNVLGAATSGASGFVKTLQGR